MNTDEIFKLTAITAPPSSDDEAIDRVSELGCLTMHGLIGAVFLDLPQIRRALAHFQWNCRESIIMRSGSKSAPGRVITSRLDARAPDGTEYEFLVNQVGSYQATIVNCRLKTVGTNIGDEDAKAFTHAMGGKEFRQDFSQAGDVQSPCGGLTGSEFEKAAEIEAETPINAGCHGDPSIGADVPKEQA